MQASEMKGYTMIQEQALRYANFVKLCQKHDNLYVVVGEPKAGKSITIDLMSNKKIIVQESNQGHLELCQEKNKTCTYNPIYYNQHANNIFLQGYTLDQSQNVATQINAVKSAFIKAGIKAVKNLTLVWVIEWNQKESCDNQLNYWLECLNEPSSEVAKVISDHIYILLTKLDEEDDPDDFNEVCEECVNVSKGSAQVLFKRIEKQKRRNFIFCSEEPEATKGQQLRTKFKPSPVSQEFIRLLETNTAFSLKPEVTANVLEFSQKLLLLFSSLLQLSLKGKSESYTKRQKDVFSAAKVSMKADKMQVKSWQLNNYSNLQKYKKILTTDNKRIAFEQILQMMNSILISLREKAAHKDGYNDMISISQFLLDICPSINANSCTEHVEKLLFPQFEKFLQLLEQNCEKQQTQGKIMGGIKDQALNLAFDKFRTSIEPLNTNEKVLIHSLDTLLNQLSSNQGWSDYIYDLKIVKDLLGQFNFAHHNPFAQQILFLYLFSGSFYEMQQLLKQYINSGWLLMTSAKTLVKTFGNCKRYTAAVQVMNYIIAHTATSSDLAVMNRIKSMIQDKADEQFRNNAQYQSANIDNSHFYRVIISLKQKIRDKNIFKRSSQSWEIFLASDSFKKYIDISEK